LRAVKWCRFQEKSSERTHFIANPALDIQASPHYADSLWRRRGEGIRAAISVLTFTMQAIWPQGMDGLRQEATMSKSTGAAAVLAGTATLIILGAHGAPSSTSASVEPSVLLGFGDSAVCLTRGKAVDNKLFYKIAAAREKNELTPYGELPRSGTAAQPAPGDPPLWNNLGTLSYNITTSQPRAQQYFNQGLRLAYGFNHEEAANAFRVAQKIDPDCAMCYWGEALVLGPNINMPMDPQAISPAVAASRRAAALKEHAGPHEQALIAALASRYSDNPKIDRATLDKAYADAMRKVAAAYPRDQDISVLFAESLMNLSPWDYWEAGGARPKGNTVELVATLENVLKANPDHPGAIHYYIHTVEASTNPKRAEKYAERLARQMPGAGHVVHMPAHIYFRVGRYKDSLATNKQAVAVDEKYIAERKPSGAYPMAYYPHNVHFVLVSAQMAGDGKTVIEAADKLAGIVTDDAAREFPIAQPVRAAPYFAHAQFSDPDTILAIPAPGEGLPYVEGLWHYARGVAFAEKGDAAAAKKESAAIERLRKTGDFKALNEALVPAQDVLQIASHIVGARAAQASGDLKRAANQYWQAIALEDNLAYMEPAYWYYPVRQSLGAVLLQQGDSEGAEKAFRDSLTRVPNNGWALYGLSEVYRKRGDARRVEATEKLLAQAWAGTREQLKLDQL
jgi:tetratricopeptide (TPR) repeat protein